MTMSRSTARPARRRLATLATALAAAGAVSACDDPLGLRASIAVSFDTLSVYAMTGTPVTYPSAYDVGNGTLARVTSQIAFDVAFDLTSDGKVKLLPARQVAASRDLGGLVIQGSPRVGLQAMPGTFESITRAPGGNYTYDSTLVVSTGQPVAIEVSSDICQFSLSSLVYAKLVVDSVNVNSRQLHFRSAVDPNCGFRSLQPGVPKN